MNKDIQKILNHLKHLLSSVETIEGSKHGIEVNRYRLSVVIDEINTDLPILGTKFENISNLLNKISECEMIQCYVREQFYEYSDQLLEKIQQKEISLKNPVKKLRESRKKMNNCRVRVPRIHEEQNQLIPCNCEKCRNSQTPYMFSYSILKKCIDDQKESIQCYNSYQMINVRDLTRTIINLNKPPDHHDSQLIHETSQNKVFISYSHKDESWKDRLMVQLNVLKHIGSFKIWDDRQISTGNDWYQEIKYALSCAKIAILLITAEFLTSQFINNEEIPVILNNKKEQGLKVIPIIIKPCAWKKITWLSSMQVLPKDGIPLTQNSENDIETILANVAEMISELE